MAVGRLSQLRKNLAGYFAGPVVRLLARTPVTPSTITWIGFLISVAAAIVIATGHLLIGGVVVLVAGMFDMLDGALARSTGRVTRLGAVLDSTLDRLAEGALLVSIMFLYASGGQVGGVLLAGIVLVGSLMVSYVRARVEAIGLECSVGWFTRPERVIVLALGLLLNQLIIALVVVAVFSWFTVGQRLVYVWGRAKD